MTKFLTAAALSVCLATSAVTAQTLQPNMSAQDIANDTSVTGTHVIVPILAMIFIGLVAVGAGSGYSDSVVSISDERLKTDIRAVGTAENGLTIYEYRYIGQPELYRGVMAQEVQAMYPNAVYEHDNGYLYVNYGMLGMQMERVQ